MLAIFSGNMVFLWACVESRKLDVVGDSARLPDPVSVETAQWSWECAAMSGGTAKESVNISVVEGED